MLRRLGVGQAEPPSPSSPGVSHVGNRTLRGRGQPGRRGAHISGPDGDPLVVRIHARNDDCHAPGTSEAQHVGFLGARCVLGQPLKGEGPATGDRWSLT